MSSSVMLMRSERSVALPQRATWVNSRNKSFLASSCNSADREVSTTLGSAKRSDSSKTASPERENVSHSAKDGVSRDGGGARELRPRTLTEEDVVRLPKLGDRKALVQTGASKLSARPANPQDVALDADPFFAKSSRPTTLTDGTCRLQQTAKARS